MAERNLFIPRFALAAHYQFFPTLTETELDEKAVNERTSHVKGRIFLDTSMKCRSCYTEYTFPSTGSS